MATPAGLAAFHHPQVNHAIREMLNAYGAFLNTTESTHVLVRDPHGWFGNEGYSALTELAVPPPNTPRFEDIYVANESLPHFGYKTWDDFFTREWRDGLRPVADPLDDNVLTNACESSPVALVHDAKLHQDFWIKGQPHSLAEILGGPENAKKFENGTLYQAYLSALSYHRWHAPVSGTVKKVLHINGTYYAENPYMGFPGGGQQPDPAGPDLSQPYIAAVATRAVVFIEADNEAIGEMALVFVGMSEVSTAEVTVGEGDKVEKGDQLGMVCLFFFVHVLCQCLSLS